MAERYEKLDKMRADIEKTKERIERLQAELKRKEGKLRDAEAEQMLSRIYEMALTPEMLDEYLDKYKSDRHQVRSNMPSRVELIKEALDDDMEESEDEE